MPTARDHGPEWRSRPREAISAAGAQPRAGRLDFDVGPENTMAILGTALATQYVCGVIWGLPAFDPKSALISGLSLCLLCRTNEPLLAVATARSEEHTSELQS